MASDKMVILPFCDLPSRTEGVGFPLTKQDRCNGFLSWMSTDIRSDTHSPFTLLIGSSISAYKRIKKKLKSNILDE